MSTGAWDHHLVSGRPLVISDHRSDWPERFRVVAASLRQQLGDDARRVDHIGSTAVPGLPAKDVIDVQITVRNLSDADRWDDELVAGLVRRRDVTVDHVPSGASDDPQEWAKRYWSDRRRIHVHVREEGRLNQRYALIFRDYLRADASAAGAYGELKRALVSAAPDDWDGYYAVKDPACDLIIAAAEHWAARVGWEAPPTDA